MRQSNKDAVSLSTSSFREDHVLESLENRVLLSVTIEQTSMPVGVDPVSVVVTDLNLDGFADIATANEDGQSFSVLFNNGDGTFADAVNFDVAGRPIQIFAETINDDQLPDIGIFDKDTDSVIIFANMGDGTFQRAATVLVGDGATSFVLGDFNADGAQDIAVVYD